MTAQGWPGLSLYGRRLAQLGAIVDPGRRRDRCHRRHHRQSRRATPAAPYPGRAAIRAGGGVQAALGNVARLTIDAITVDQRLLAWAGRGADPLSAVNERAMDTFLWVTESRLAAVARDLLAAAQGQPVLLDEPRRRPSAARSSAGGDLRQRGDRRGDSGTDLALAASRAGHRGTPAGGNPDRPGSPHAHRQRPVDIAPMARRRDRGLRPAGHSRHRCGPQCRR
jgi:hypothetical protein